MAQTTCFLPRTVLLGVWAMSHEWRHIGKICPKILKWTIWRHNSAAHGPIWTKFGTLMQNNTTFTTKWSRSKAEIEYQYGGHLFFQTGSSYISAVNWDMSTKFGLLTDFDLLEALTLTSMKPEVVLSGRGCHLEKWIWRHISAVGAPIWTEFGSLMQNNRQITKKMVEIETGSRIPIW